MKYGAKHFNHADRALSTWCRALAENLKTHAFASPADLLAHVKHCIAAHGVTATATMLGGHVNVQDGSGLLMQLKQIQ